MQENPFSWARHTSPPSRPIQGFVRYVSVCVCQFLRRGTAQLWVLLSRADRDRRADRSGFVLLDSRGSNNDDITSKAAIGIEFTARPRRVGQNACKRTRSCCGHSSVHLLRLVRRITAAACNGPWLSFLCSHDAAAPTSVSQMHCDNLMTPLRCSGLTIRQNTTGTARKCVGASASNQS